MSKSSSSFEKSLLSFLVQQGSRLHHLPRAIVLIYLFGHVFGLFGHNSAAGISIAVVNLSPNRRPETHRCAEDEKTFAVITTYDSGKAPPGR